MANETLGSIDHGEGRLLEVVRGDLLAEEVDAIVNAANGQLTHGGGVAAVIARAAGPELQAESDRLVSDGGPVPTGGAAVTTAGKLPFKGVIHAVGPRMGEGDEHERLVSALFSSFLRADEMGWTSVSLPGVSSGIFAVPHDICASAYLKAVSRFWEKNPASAVRLIRLVLFEGPLLDEVLRLFPAD